MCTPDWFDATVIRDKRCGCNGTKFCNDRPGESNQWSVNPIDRSTAMARCDNDTSCKGVMYYNNCEGDGRRVESGWYQSCHGEVGVISNPDWDIILKPYCNLSTDVGLSGWSPSYGEPEAVGAVVDSQVCKPSNFIFRFTLRQVADAVVGVAAECSDGTRLQGPAANARPGGVPSLLEEPLGFRHFVLTQTSRLTSVASSGSQTGVRYVVECASGHKINGYRTTLDALGVRSIALSCGQVKPEESFTPMGVGVCVPMIYYSLAGGRSSLEECKALCHDEAICNFASYCASCSNEQGECRRAQLFDTSCLSLDSTGESAKYLTFRKNAQSWELIASGDDGVVGTLSPVQLKLLSASRQLAVSWSYSNRPSDTSAFNYEFVRYSHALRLGPSMLHARACRSWSFNSPKHWI
jgi:hypothetical protein